MDSACVACLLLGIPEVYNFGQSVTDSRKMFGSS
jgi:hypothetical protein